ncbi:zinc finger protein 91-like [Belonocnema kinseyi]|uniref:zinc finger protein 91-like n=1 Tax=Belonocnema kinseyi TaxID=2817044 RepID=UPI00143D1820|nr:zinc finger protein 91-like [Belonocnema kinseyi]
MMSIQFRNKTLTGQNYKCGKCLQAKSESKKSTVRKDGGPYSCITTAISSGNKSGAKTIQCETDDPLEIKQEVIEDPSKFCTVYIKEDDILEDKPQPQTIKKQKIQEAEEEKKHRCEKCARSYKRQKSLREHQKYYCDVKPQFICKFCGKEFRRNRILNSHIVRSHQKSTSKILEKKHKCDKCPRSYTWVNALNEHKRSVHAAVKPEFKCDYCAHITNRKSSLAKHMMDRHLKSKKRQRNIKA